MKKKSITKSPTSKSPNQSMTTPAANDNIIPITTVPPVEDSLVEDSLYIQVEKFLAELGQKSLINAAEVKTLSHFHLLIRKRPLIITCGNCIAQSRIGLIKWLKVKKEELENG